MFFKNSNPGLQHNHAGSWVCSLNYPLTERWLKLVNISPSCKSFKSELPPHREVIETSSPKVSEKRPGQSELPPHRKVFEPNPRYPKKISGIFLCKKLKNTACPGIHSERKSSWENLRKKFPKNLKNLLVLVYIVKGDDHMVKNFCDVPMFRWFSDIHSSRGYSHEQIFSVLCSGVPLWHVARLSLFTVCRRAWLLLWFLQIKLKKPDIPGIDNERWWSTCRYLL